QRRRQDWLDEYLQRSSTDQAGIVLGIVVEIEGQRSRFFFFHHLARSLPTLGLDAAAADGAHNRAVVADQHLRRLERRNRPTHVCDGGDSSAASFTAKLHDLLVDIHRRQLSL